jgi:hypothetical protein
MKLSHTVFSYAGPAAVFGLALLSACTVVVEEPGPLPGPGPQICTREYEPVCARRGGERRTFANGCLADRAGYDVVRRGECRRDVVVEEEPRFCTREYQPVCGRRGDSLRTFGNECEADAAGYRVIDEGEC